MLIFHCDFQDFKVNVGNVDILVYFNVDVAVFIPVAHVDVNGAGVLMSLVMSIFVLLIPLMMTMKVELTLKISTSYQNYTFK